MQKAEKEKETQQSKVSAYKRSLYFVRYTIFHRVIWFRTIVPDLCHRDRQIAGSSEVVFPSRAASEMIHQIYL